MDRIEIILIDCSRREILELLIDYFSYEKSPLYPIKVGYSTNILKREKDELKVEFINLRVEEVIEEMDISSKLYSTIRLASYNNRTVILFDRAVDLDVTEDEWGKVISIVKEIIKKAETLGFTILEKNPNEKFSESSEEQPWEKIEDRGNDRTMVKLWRQGYTNSEIAKKLGSGYIPETITKRLSFLRTKYGSEIVPKKKDVLEELLKNDGFEYLYIVG